MAPRALKQMSQTITTLQPFVTCCPLSPSLSNPHPPSVANNTFSLYLVDMSATSPILTCTCALAHATSHTHNCSHSHSHLRTDNHTETCSIHSPPITHIHLMSACNVTDSRMRSCPCSFAFSFARIHIHICTLTIVPRLAAVARVHTNKPDVHIGVCVHWTRVCALDLTRYTLDFVHFHFDIAHALCSHRAWHEAASLFQPTPTSSPSPVRHAIAIASSFLTSMSRDWRIREFG
jgi:hypothetical protein